MAITEQSRTHTEQRIRAAADRLLRGEIPPGGGCDVKTLAADAGISRAALYRTYAHLKQEFEQRLDRLRAQGQTPDPREAQIARLKTENTTLKQRLAQRADEIAALTEFKATAVSRLAAQHDEITRLRQLAASRASLAVLPTTRPMA